MTHTYNDMQECTAEEYRRVYDLYKGKLTVFASYSGSIPGIDGLVTSWGIRGMKSQLISSGCESKYRTNDPKAWTYYVNKDLVDALATVADLKEALEELVAAQDANDEGWFDSPKMCDVAMQKARTVLAKCAPEKKP